jgi:hypothetical protein
MSLSRAAEIWLRLNQELLRGAVHALNNRIAAVDAIAYAAAEQERVADDLQQETERLRLLSEDLQLLLDRGEVETQPLSDLLSEAARLAALHPATRELTVAPLSGSPPAVRLRPTAGRRALTMALVAGAGGAGGTGVAGALRCSWDDAGDQVEVRVPLARESLEAERLHEWCEAADAYLAGEGGQATIVTGAAPAFCLRLPARRPRAGR